MEPRRCTVDGKPGRIKRLRLRDDGTMVAHVRLDDGPLLVVDAERAIETLTGQAKAKKAGKAGTDGEDQGAAAADD